MADNDDQEMWSGQFEDQANWPGQYSASARGTGNHPNVLYNPSTPPPPIDPDIISNSPSPPPLPKLRPIPPSTLYNPLNGEELMAIDEPEGAAGPSTRQPAPIAAPADGVHQEDELDERELALGRYMPSNRPIPREKRLYRPKQKKVKSKTAKKKAPRALNKRELRELARTDWEIRLEEDVERTKKFEEERKDREAEMKLQILEREADIGWKEGQKTHFLDLPVELLDMIFSFDQGYTIKDYMCIAGTCWTMRAPFQDDELWRAIYVKFGPPITSEYDRHDKFPGTISLSFNQLDPPETLSNDSYAVWEEINKPTNYTYKVVHMDVAAGKRAPNLGELINDLNRYARAVWPAAGKNPRMLAQQEPNVKKRFMKALEWYTTQLPLSRNELIVDLPKVEEGEEEEEDDEEDEDAVEKQGAFQLKVRAFKYGPWQVLAHRYAHWKMEEPYTAIRNAWLDKDEMDLLSDRAGVEPSKQPKNGSVKEKALAEIRPVRAVDIADYKSRWELMLHDRIKRRSPTIRVYKRNLEAFRGKRQIHNMQCEYCHVPHESNQACRWWYTLPDNEDCYEDEVVGAGAGDATAAHETVMAATVLASMHVGSATPSTTADVDMQDQEDDDSEEEDSDDD